MKMCLSLVACLCGLAIAGCMGDPTSQDSDQNVIINQFFGTDGLGIPVPPDDGNDNGGGGNTGGVIDEGPWGKWSIDDDGVTYHVWLNPDWYATTIGNSSGTRYFEEYAGAGGDFEFTVTNGECVVLSVVGPKTHVSAGDTTHYPPYCP